jgi:Tol biopolymer transport system component
MDPDGRRLTNLTHKQKQKGSDSDPQWSPDGTRIAFVSDRDGQSDIWVMGQDGSNARNLTRGGGDDVNPRWSPDGKRIAFATFRDGDGEVYVMTADGAEQTNLTKSDSDDLQPVWSPDSAQIAFVSDRAKRPRTLYTLSVNAPKDPFRVAAPACDVRDPVWSPDGKTIAIVACAGADGQGSPDTSLHVVYTIPAAGGNLTAVSDTKVESGGPTFTPDGRSLAFYSYRSPKEADIMVYTIAGGNRRVIQGTPGASREPAWSADGTLLAFVAGDFMVGNLIIGDPSGLVHNMTNNVANERTPRWSPVKLP